MKIQPSILAADIFHLEKWIENLANSGIDTFHIDFVDPSFANTIGIDFRILEKLQQMNLKFTVHYMAYWNEGMISQILKYHPTSLFLHSAKIQDMNFFKQISQTHNIGIAIELNEFAENEMPNIDCPEYLLMNVKLGYCGQTFNDSNLPLARKLQTLGKKITSDGGITLENIDQIVYFDSIVIGNALNKNSVEEFTSKFPDLKK